MIKIVENKKKSYLVYENIIELIKNNNLKKGDLLPPQGEISKKFKVGMQAIREGYSGLETIGIIKIKVGFGTVVDIDNINLFLR